MEITAFITYLLISQMRLLRVFVIDHLLFCCCIEFALGTEREVPQFIFTGTCACTSKCYGLQRNLWSSYQEIHSIAFLVVIRIGLLSLSSSSAQ